MCLALPYKITKVGKKQIELEILGQKKMARESLVKVRPGDFVLLQNGIIIKKVSKRSAQEVLKLFSGQCREEEEL